MCRDALDLITKKAHHKVDDRLLKWTRSHKCGMERIDLGLEPSHLNDQNVEKFDFMVSVSPIGLPN